MTPAAESALLPAPAPQVLVASLGDETVLLDLAGKRYHQLNASGTVIWQALEAGGDRASATRALTEAFDVPAEVAAGAVDRLLGELAAHQLVAGC